MLPLSSLQLSGLKLGSCWVTPLYYCNTNRFMAFNCWGLLVLIYFLGCGSQFSGWWYYMSFSLYETWYYHDDRDKYNMKNLSELHESLKKRQITKSFSLEKYYCQPKLFYFGHDSVNMWIFTNFFIIQCRENEMCRSMIFLEPSWQPTGQSVRESETCLGSCFWNWQFSLYLFCPIVGHKTIDED